MQTDVQTWLAARAADFKQLPNGRVRCLLDGSEFVPKCEILVAFVGGKKYKRLKERQEQIQALHTFEPFFVPSKNFEDKAYCALTGQLIGMRKDDIEAHMKGKKFRKAKEALLENRQGLKPEPDIADLLGDIDQQTEVEPTNTEPDAEVGVVTVDGMDVDEATDNLSGHRVPSSSDRPKRKHCR